MEAKEETLDKMIINPLKGRTPFGWHFEQNVYSTESITRAVKAGGGTGNIPKVIIYERNYKDTDKCR